MRTLLLFVLLLGTAAFLPAAEDGSVCELRTYTAAPGRLDDVLARFRDHTIGIFNRHGMVSVGYWVPQDAKDGAGEKLVYLLRHPSREAAVKNWAAFRADPEWQSVAKASEAHGKIVIHTESVFLAPADFSPEVAMGSGPGAPRVFELRTYTAPEGKLAELDARFRSPERSYFVRHGMMEVGYFHPLDAAAGAGHTFVYMLAHASRQAATASWAGFHADPDWVALKAVTEKEGPLTTKVVSVFLAPTDFSPLK
jgi:NIPSNAP